MTGEEMIELNREYTIFSCGLTYSSHTLGCADAVAALGAYHEEGLIENAARLCVAAQP